MTPDPEHRISAEHQAKCAIVYARQSTSQQVRSCRESTRLQLGLREKAISLGWTRPLVLEEDLGISAAGFVSVSSSTGASSPRAIAASCEAKDGSAKPVLWPAPT